MSNTSNVVGSNGIPDRVKSVKRSNMPSKSAFALRESSILILRSGPNFGANSVSNENEIALASDKDGEKPNATAMCGRNSSTA